MHQKLFRKSSKSSLKKLNFLASHKFSKISQIQTENFQFSPQNLNIHCFFINLTSNLTNWPTTLESLTLDRVNIPDGKLAQFLLLQKPTLKSLSVRPLIPYEIDRYLNVTLNKLKIKSLTLDTDFVSRNLEFQPNDFIENLTLTGEKFDEKIFKLIKSLRNLRSLNVEKFPNFQLSELFIRKLTIEKILKSEEFLKVAEILKTSKSLKYFSCRILSKDFNFEKFENLIKNSKITKIQLEIFDDKFSDENLTVSGDKFYPEVEEKCNGNFINVNFKNEKEENCEISYKFVISNC